MPWASGRAREWFTVLAWRRMQVFRASQSAQLIPPRSSGTSPARAIRGRSRHPIPVRSGSSPCRRPPCRASAGTALPATDSSPAPRSTVRDTCPAFGIAPSRCIVNSVTIVRLALCGVHGMPACLRHLRHAQRPGEPAQVADIGLHDVDRAHRDHLPPGRDPAVLLAAGDVEVERVAHFLRLLELPVRARLLVVARCRAPAAGGRPRSPRRTEKPLFASTSSATSPPRPARIAGTISSVRPGHSSTSWPHSAPTRNLNASKPYRSRRAGQARDLVARRDVALHRGRVGAQAAAACRPAARRRSCPRACRAGPTARCRARPSRGRGTSRGTCARARG